MADADALTHQRTAVLDNAVWHSIAGPHELLAERAGQAGRFHRDVAPFMGIADPSDPGAWADLGRLVGPGHRAMLFGPRVDPPPGWVLEHTIPCVQMVATHVVGGSVDLDLVDLTPADVPEMLELVAATRPGPFSERTIELGRYLGHRADGRLVAMAGERMRVAGWTEVSAVCTAAEHRGKGLGGALTRAVTNHIRSRGDEAFLHASSDNTTAIALYETLGFTVRRSDLEVVILRVPEEA